MAKWREQAVDQDGDEGAEADEGWKGLCRGVSERRSARGGQKAWEHPALGHARKRKGLLAAKAERSQALPTPANPLEHTITLAATLPLISLITIVGEQNN